MDCVGGIVMCEGVRGEVRGVVGVSGRGVMGSSLGMGELLR